MPTCAAVIMFTSLAPSPTAIVRTLGSFSRTKVTISAFYFGETLQATITSHIYTMLKNGANKSSLLAIRRNDFPETIRAILPAKLTSRALFSYSRTGAVDLPSIRI